MSEWPSHVWHRLTLGLTLAVVVGVLSATLTMAYVTALNEGRTAAYWRCLIGRSGTWFETSFFYACLGVKLE